MSEKTMNRTALRLQMLNIVGQDRMTILVRLSLTPLGSRTLSVLRSAGYIAEEIPDGRYTLTEEGKALRKRWNAEAVAEAIKPDPREADR